MHKIGIIGGGNMGEAIISSVRRKFFVSVAEKDKTRSDYLRFKYKIKIFDLENLISSSDIIVLAVKPQDIEDVLRRIRDHLENLSFPNASVGNLDKAISGPPTKTFGGDSSKLIISIAAGITTSYIEKILGKKIKVIRTMPNMPAMIGEGITAVCAGKYAIAPDINVACKIFDHLGKTVVVKEEFMDTITAVSGSGPAYVFFFMECLVKASEALGLKSDLSKELVMATFLGSIHLLEKQKIEPGTLRAKVTSKGGTTAAALEVFLKGKFDHLVQQALLAAKKRAKELAK